MFSFLLGAITGAAAITYWASDRAPGRRGLRSRLADRVDTLERRLTARLRTLSQEVQTRLRGEPVPTAESRISRPGGDQGVRIGG